MMPLGIERMHDSDSDPLLWHLIEARDAALVMGLIDTAEAVGHAIVIVLQEFKSLKAPVSLRVIRGKD